MRSADSQNIDSLSRRADQLLSGGCGIWTFTGTAGQRVVFDFSAGTYGSNAYAPLSITKPDGTSLLNGKPGCSTSCWIDATTLPVTGTITIDPYKVADSLTAKLYNVPTDAVQAVTIGGAAQTVSTAAAGQNAAFTFTGNAGQRVTIALNQNTFGGTVFTVKRPDGTTLSSSTSSTNATFQQITLPTSGQYTVSVDPQGSVVGSVTGSVVVS